MTLFIQIRHDEAHRKTYLFCCQVTPYRIIKSVSFAGCIRKTTCQRPYHVRDLILNFNGGGKYSKFIFVGNCGNIWDSYCAKILRHNFSIRKLFQLISVYFFLHMLDLHQGESISNDQYFVLCIGLNFEFHQLVMWIFLRSRTYHAFILGLKSVSGIRQKKSPTHVDRNLIICTFLCVIQKYTKFANFTWLHSLRYFIIELHNFTKFLEGKDPPEWINTLLS
jgi:hypothetical protein